MINNSEDPSTGLYRNSIIQYVIRTKSRAVPAKYRIGELTRRLLFLLREGQMKNQEKLEVKTRKGIG